MTNTQRTRVLALAVQNYGANASTVKALLEDVNYGVSDDLTDRQAAQVLALAANVKDGRL